MSRSPFLPTLGVLRGIEGGLFFMPNLPLGLAVADPLSIAESALFLFCNQDDVLRE